MCTPGTLTPLWFEITPPFTTVQMMSSPRISFTISSMSPSSIKIRFPGFSSWYNCGYVIDAIEAFPRISRPVSTNCCPGSNVTFPSSNIPVRISGPFVSKSIATGFPHFSRIALRRSIRSFCSSWLPCEKLKRATFMPPCINFSKTSSESVAGPIVHIIFVFRINKLLSLSAFYHSLS